jgi:hypothetical protein
MGSSTESNSSANEITQLPPKPALPRLLLLACVISAAMLLLSPTLVCMEGCLVIYFLVAAGIASLPAGFGHGRTKALGFILLLASLISAGKDNLEEMERHERYVQRYLQLMIEKSSPTTQPATQSSAERR